MHASHLASLVWRGREASEHATGCWKPSLNVALLTTRGRELTTSERSPPTPFWSTPFCAHRPERTGAYRSCFQDTCIIMTHLNRATQSDRKSTRLNSSHL